MQRQTESSLAQGRLAVLRLLIAVAAVALIGRLWQLQMVDGENYRLLADRNRFRQVDVAAPRGVIYDRNGQILARNRPSFTVVLVPADLPVSDPATTAAYRGPENALPWLGAAPKQASAVVLDRLLGLLYQAPSATVVTPTPVAAVKESVNEPVAPVFDIPDRQPWVMPRAEIEQAIADAMVGGAYRPIAIATHIRQDTAFAIAEDAINLPGVQLEPEPIRDYLSGQLTSQIIGYMGHVPESEVEDYTAKGYPPNAQVGLTGVEFSFEPELHGQDGRQTIEVDVNGRKVRTVGELDPAQPGHNLWLTLDLDLQRVATAALQDALDNSAGFTKATQGAVIALDPRNGAVRAIVSLPSYDNNLFAKGITQEAWNALTTDPDRPLFNRAIGGQYPPGSTFKIIVASAGLQTGVIGTRTLLGDGFDGSNDGVIWLPNQYFSWDRSKDQPFYSWIHKYGYGHGLTAVRDALAVSDDIFFYQLGGGYRQFPGLGVDAVGEYARAFGLSQPTGIDLPGESRGLVPDRKWKRLNYAETWVTGDTYNMSIGQGYLLATPMQMANATAAVANHGFLYRPQLVERVTDSAGKVVRTLEPDLIREVPVNAANLDTVREGMYGAVNWPNGTATRVKVPGVIIAGKTGTAEYFRDDDHDFKADRDQKGNLPTHAWFTSFAPYVDPEIVVTVFIANGGEGSSAAAPVATRILQAYFGAKTQQQAAAK
jgi:penicillin-binding protein 2